MLACFKVAALVLIGQSSQTIYTPHFYRLLFNKDDRRDLWGVMNMLPLEEEVIFQLLRGEIKVADLDLQKDILTFDQLC